jgi:transposase
MVYAEDAIVGRGVRRRRSIAEKRHIVQLTMEPGASVAEVARVHGVNANQLFKWRRLFERGELFEAGASSTALLPVSVCGSCETGDKVLDPGPQPQASGSGAIHIELPGRAMISVERGADPVLLRSVLESLRK